MQRRSMQLRNRHRRGIGAQTMQLIVAAFGLLAAYIPSVSAAFVPPDADDVPSRGTAAGGQDSGARITTTTVAPSSPAPTVNGASGVAQPESPARLPQGPVAVAFPHPMITEVLFAVPTGSAGDANRDGVRSVNGDEFVELINPHDRPIELQGYMLTDSTSGTNQFRFVFPKMQLAPGATVVIFNGNDAKWDAAGANAEGGLSLGDARAAARSASAVGAGFSGAWLLTAGATKSGVGFANESDSVMLSASGGVAVHRVWWGSGKPLGEARPLLDEQAPDLKGASAQRESCAPGALFKDHHDIAWTGDSTLFSPGWVPGLNAVPASTPADQGTQPIKDASR